MWQYGRNAALSAADYVTPVLTESQFATKGVLTPLEFVAAGDMLVLRCPTWQWQAGDLGKARSFLPPNKQFLLTRNVPCQRRACTLMHGADDEQEIGVGEDSWIATHASKATTAVADGEAPDILSATPPVRVADAEAMGTTGGASAVSYAAVSANWPSSAADLDEIAAAMQSADDPSALDSAVDSAILRTRTYDVSISYDKYYQ